MLRLIIPCTLLAALATVAYVPTSNHNSDPFEEPLDEHVSRIPTIHESTVMARRIMHLSTISTLITTFPSPEHPSGDYETSENRPADVAGAPIGLMEYYADCEPSTGNPTLLAINIASPYKNYAAGSNISMHIRWWPTQKTTYATSSSSWWSWPWSSRASINEDPDIPTPHTPAALPRFSLHGRLEPIPSAELEAAKIPACFMRAHPDSVLWQPGNDIHTSQYMRFVVEHVYWFGGFGDRARIGWLPIEEWKGVTRREIEGLRLPGEEVREATRGWMEWL